jgi:hypothetical protein
MMSVNLKKYDMLDGIDSISHSFIKIHYPACFVDLHTSCIKFLGVLSLIYGFPVFLAIGVCGDWALLWAVFL